MKVINVEIILVEPKKGTGRTGSEYEYLEVTYRELGGERASPKGYKALKFNTDESVYAILASSAKGATLSVTMEKNAANYWQWTEVSRQDGPPTQGAGKPVTEKAAAYAEQDARRQQLIVRQSCLERAVTFNAHIGDMDLASVLGVAEQFESWVNR